MLKNKSERQSAAPPFGYEFFLLTFNFAAIRIERIMINIWIRITIVTVRNQDSIIIDSRITHKTVQADLSSQDSRIMRRTQQADLSSQDSRITRRTQQADLSSRDSRITRRTQQADPGVLIRPQQKRI